MNSSASLVLQQSSPGTFRPLNRVSKKILESGWAASTTRQYAAAVNKFFTCMDGAPFRFPLSSRSIYRFVLWCGDSNNRLGVLSNTTRRYLTGLRMWHTLHGVPFPRLDENRLRLILKATKKCEPPRLANPRLGLTLTDVNSLINTLCDDTIQNTTLRGVVLVGFWGLARLGELTLHDDHPDIFVRRRDVHFSKTYDSATITLRLAKTAGPGELQYLNLCRQPNRLDPVRALRQILSSSNGGPDDPLFCDGHHSLPIKKAVVLSLLKKLQPASGGFWSGHSLRIGGASLRHNLGDSIESLKKAGRWRSSAYTLYIKKYSSKVLTETRNLAQRLRNRPSKEICI